MLNDFAARMLSERYCVEQEGPEDVFRRVAKYYGSNAAHSARLLDYMNRLWFIPATPILSNGGTSRGLPISCFLNTIPDNLAGIAEHWVESMFMSVKGGGVGCVDADTEFLTDRGWVRIADYQGQDICVVEPDTHTAYFEQPLQYIKMPCSELFRFTSRYHEIVVSRDHRNYGKTNGLEGFKVIPTSQLLHNVRNFRIPSNITIRNRPGLPFTDLELRFLVALAADGTERHSGDIKFSFVRHRKIERLRFLLTTLGIDYSESQESHDRHDRTVFVLRQSGLKKLPLTFENFGDASVDQLRVIVDELGYWDGSFDLRTHHVQFATSRQDEADFVQFAMTNAFDTRSGLSIKARHRQEHHATEYVVRQTGDQLTMFSGVESMVPLDGNQYCFTTSTGLWLARHKGLVFITGNSSWRDVRSVGQKTKTGGTSTGVGAFMHVSDSLMLAANQGGTRRGSMVVWQDISHPEVKSHILMRSPTGGDLNRKNLNLHTGVNITDAFMVAVLNDADWDLVDPHSKEVVETVRARELWQLLMEAPLNGSQGEPFIHWIDRSNEKLHPDLKQKGLVVNGLNLCVAPETKILTDSGWHEIHTLADQDVMVWNGTRFAIARVEQTAKQVKLLRVVLSDGTELDCTPEHHFYLATGVKKEASDLVPGDIIQKFSLPVIASCANQSIEERLAWLAGITVDGVVCGDKDLLNEARLVLQTLGIHSRITANGLHITDTVQDDVLVLSVTDLGRISDTYCFNEPTEHKGILNGVLTGNCCEIALPTAADRSAVCCLSSVNLERWDSWSNVPGFIEDIVEFLDNVLSDFIIKAPKELWRAVVSAKGDRSIGLGAMGFHSYLQKHNIPLDSPVARGLNKQMFSYIKEAAQHANSRLAHERGPADDLKQDRFAHLLAVAPNASTALIADVSPSIEPWNRNYYIQDTLSGAMVHKNRELDKTISKLAVSMEHYDEMWNDVRQNGGSVQHVIWLDNDQKDVFRTAFEVDQRVLIQLAADRQQHICQSQSLNLFFAAGTSVSYINECHLLAWKLGLKSRYYMRTTRERVATSFSNFEAQGNACVGGACDG